MNPRIRSNTTVSLLKSALDYTRAALARAEKEGEETASIDLAVAHLMRATEPDAPEKVSDAARRFSLLELDP